MSLSTSNRRGLAYFTLSICLSIYLAGCASSPIDVGGYGGALTSVQQKESEVLEHRDTLLGGIEGNRITGQVPLRFIRPVAVAAQNNFLFVVDDGHKMVFRYDVIGRELKVVKELTGVTAGEIADIHVSPDLSFYLADPINRRVMHFNKNGRLIKTFSNKLNLASPVAITVDDLSGHVWVADGFYDHVVALNFAGDLVGAIGGRGEEKGRFLNITHMGVGPDGVYITSRFGRRVQVLDPAGPYRYSFRVDDNLRFPLSISVDHFNRAFVSDYLDNTIKIYERGELIEIFGGTGVAAGRFKRIKDLYVDGHVLYVADSLNGRVQMFTILKDEEELEETSADEAVSEEVPAETVDEVNENTESNEPEVEEEQSSNDVTSNAVPIGEALEGVPLVDDESTLVEEGSTEVPAEGDEGTSPASSE